MSNGKGDKRRPSQVPRSEFEANWDRIFSKAKKARPKTPAKGKA